MATNRFDSVIASLTAPTARRGALGLLGGALARVLTRREIAAASCTKLGKSCNRRRGDLCCGNGKCAGNKCRCAKSAAKINGACFLQGTCPPNADVCDKRCGNAPSDGLHDGCYCGTTVEGETLCFKNASLCQRPCQTSGDCPTGMACFATTCEPASGTCFKPCPAKHVSD